MLETATDMIRNLQDSLSNDVQSVESNASIQTLLMLRIMARPEHIDTFNKQVSSFRLKPISFSK
jgi:threonyl-tRNA synthetase